MDAGLSAPWHMDFAATLRQALCSNEGFVPSLPSSFRCPQFRVLGQRPKRARSCGAMHKIFPRRGGCFSNGTGMPAVTHGRLAARTRGGEEDCVLGGAAEAARSRRTPQIVGRPGPHHTLVISFPRLLSVAPKASKREHMSL